MAGGRKLERLVISLATVLITLIVPGLVLERLGLRGAGVVGLVGLAAVIATAVLGWRVGALVGVCVTVGTVLADAAGGSWWAATLVMVLASVAYGFSALRGWQHGVVLAPIALAFVVADPPSGSWSGDRPLLAIALATAVTVAFGVLVAAALARGKEPKPQPAVSPLRARGFAIMVGIAAAITTPITVLGGWGHAGAWLIMTPLIVIQPSLKDAVGKSIRRAAGTVAGFVIALGVSTVIPEPWALYVIGSICAGVALYGLGRAWDYSIVATALTVAVILLEGVSTSVADTGRWRLIATLLGVGIAIALSAAMTPLYKVAIKRANDTRDGDESMTR